MGPTRTSTILRKILKDLKSDIRLCPYGYVIDEIKMPDPSEEDFPRKYLAYNLARKRESDGVTPAQARNALAKWVEQERRNRVVNIYGGWYFPITETDKSCLSRLKMRATAIISDVLLEVWPTFRFDPTSGATSSTPRKWSWGFTKVDGTPVTSDPVPHKCNKSAQDLLYEMFSQNLGVARRYAAATQGVAHDNYSFSSVPYYKDLVVRNLCATLCEDVPPALLDIVPKNNEEGRLIAKSSSLTIMIQKIFGSSIRKALRRVGVDLNDQQVNQAWAAHGAATGEVATVDLSSASDSICLHHLTYFPRRWQEFFLATRDTHVTAGTQRQHKLAMVAGMGNGYIFELESLLFYAMARAVVEELNLDISCVSVYGDDIIIPSQAYDLLMFYFTCEGFRVNDDKSFHEGPFRESCGKHYLGLVDVTPIYVKGDLDKVEDLYHLINGLSHWQRRTGVDIESTILYLLDQIPENKRNLVPTNWSSRSGLHDARPTVRLPVRKWSKRYQRYDYVYTVHDVGFTDLRDRFGGGLQVTAWLCQAENREYLLSPARVSRQLYFLLVRSRPIIEAVVMTVPGDGKDRVVQKRSESFLGDA